MSGQAAITKNRHVGMTLRLIANLLLFAFSFQTMAGDSAKRPNILFIMTDQQAADATSCRMGLEYLRTPNMDRLAKRGTIFARAYVANPLCMPSRNSIFTGRYPHETGVTSNGNLRNFDAKKFTSLGTYFRKAGYETAYTGKWHLGYDAKNTNAHGFELVSLGKKTEHDAGVTADAVRFLGQPHSKPFLLVASFLNPHNICEWARKLAGRDKQVFTCGEIGEPPPLEQLPPLPANFAPPRNEPDGMTFMRRAYQVDSGAFPVAKFSEADWRKLRWGYYRMIEMVDAEIGKVLDALRKNGLEDNTVVVFTADHGECAGAHCFNQKTVLYEESVRVPLIIANKGRSAGGVNDKLVNTGIDLLPTMLDFAGLEIPKRLPGRSLAPLVSGKRVKAWRDCVVAGNNMIQSGQVDGVTPQMEGRMVRSERYKYCVYNNGNQRESLVDLNADPGEMVNLATDPKYAKKLRQHRKLLERFGKEQNDPLVAELLADNVKPIPFVAAKRESATASETQLSK